MKNWGYIPSIWICWWWMVKRNWLHLRKIFLRILRPVLRNWLYYWGQPVLFCVRIWIVSGRISRSYCVESGIMPEIRIWCWKNNRWLRKSVCPWPLGRVNIIWPLCRSRSISKKTWIWWNGWFPVWRKYCISVMKLIFVSRMIMIWNIWWSPDILNWNTVFYVPGISVSIVFSLF